MADSNCPKKIYVDVDDVLAKTTDTYAEIINQEFGKKVRYEDLVCFDLKKSFGLTDNEFHYFFDFVHQPDILREYEPVEGAVARLCQWSDQGHCIDIVTGRPASARDVTIEWLNKQGMYFSSLTMVDKYNRPGNDPAVSISREELSSRNYDFAVEDSREMAVFLAAQMNVSVALYDRPWNAGPAGHENIRRVSFWQEIDL